MSVPRYSQRPFPPYTYVPGAGNPHPVSDPRGHMYAAAETPPVSLDPTDWQPCEPYRYAVDLFNAGYYWEAHEVWESLWHAAGRQGTVANFLKGLIKLAAAGVKSLERNPAGVQRHLTRAFELLNDVVLSVSPQRHSYCGLEVSSLRKCAADLLQMDQRSASSKWRLPLIIQLDSTAP